MRDDANILIELWLDWNLLGPKLLDKTLMDNLDLLTCFGTTTRELGKILVWQNFFFWRSVMWLMICHFECKLSCHIEKNVLYETITAYFCLFPSFSHHKSITYWKKHICYGLGFEPGAPESRRKRSHWAMAAAHR